MDHDQREQRYKDINYLQINISIQYNAKKKTNSVCVCTCAHLLNLIILNITWSVKEVRIAKMG